MAILKWSQETGIDRHYIAPGKPTQNAVIESFKRKFRDESFSLDWFPSLTDAQHVIDAWRADYNTVRPHRSLQQHAPRHPNTVSRSLELTPTTLPTCLTPVWEGGLGIKRTATLRPMPGTNADPASARGTVILSRQLPALLIPTELS